MISLRFIHKFKHKKLLVLIALLFVIVTSLSAATISKWHLLQLDNREEELPVSTPISYTQIDEDKDVVSEGEINLQLEGTVIVETPIQKTQITPKVTHTNPTVPKADLPILPTPISETESPETIQEDKCNDPENTWLEFIVGDSERQQFGGNGMEYTYLEGTFTKITGYPSYSCIDSSEIVEMWYDITSDKVQCNCGYLNASSLKAGNYQMLYLIGVRDIVYYDYITLIITPKPKPNSIPTAKILTPHGHFETKIINTNTYTFDLYGEMRDEEDGIIISGDSLKWYRTDTNLEYLFDSSGSYTVIVSNCATVQVTLTLRVWDSTGVMNDDTFTVNLKNENCSEIDTN